MKKILTIFLAFVLMMSFAGVSVSAANVSLTKTSVTISVGNRTSVSLKGASGKIVWGTTNNKVCKYSKGYIYGVGKGTATVYAKYKNKTYKCKVTVTKNGGSIKVSDKTVNLCKGEKASVTVYCSGLSNSLSVYIDKSSVCDLSASAGNDGSFILTMTGKSTGNATLTIYDDEDPDVYASVAINVTSSGSDEYDSDSVVSVSDYVDEVIRLVNVERTSRGLDELSKNSELCDNANVRADEVGRVFSHTRPDGRSCFTAVTVRSAYVAENIAIGQDSPSDVVEAWMNSKGHRENILGSNFTEIGVGYDSDTDAWVQLFIG